MGLTAEVELSLRDSGLVAFFQAHEDDFIEMFEASRSYVRGYVDSVHLSVRPDDVANNLIPALMAHEPTREFLIEHKLRQKYWYQRLADLICDRLWVSRSETT